MAEQGRSKKHRLSRLKTGEIKQTLHDSIRKMLTDPTTISRFKRLHGEAVNLFTDDRVYYGGTRNYESRGKCSEIVLVPLQGEINEEQRDLSFAIKTYRDMCQIDPEKVTEREIEIPFILADKTDKVVKIYFSEVNHNHITFVMEDLGPKTLGKFYRQLDSLELAVLENLFERWEDPSIEEAGIDATTHTDRLVLDGLRDIGFVVNEWGRNWKLDTRIGLVDERFEYDGRDLIEKQSFKGERTRAFKSALDSILEFDEVVQDYGKNTRLRRLFKSDNRETRTEKWFKNWEYAMVMANHKSEPENFKNLYKEVVDKFLLGFPQGPIIGNCKPLNFIYAPPSWGANGGHRSVIIDLYRAKNGTRILRGATSLLELGKLTCDLNNSSYKNCIEHINSELSANSEFKEFQEDFENNYHIFSFDRISVYYSKACASVLNMLEQKKTSADPIDISDQGPNYNTKFLAEFIIKGAQELFYLATEKDFDQTFRETIIPCLSLKNNRFREFVEKQLPPEYETKLKEHNKAADNYITNH